MQAPPKLPEHLPDGVTLRDPLDFKTLRSDIYDGVKTQVGSLFPLNYGGVRLEVDELDYEDPDDFDLATQKKALLEDKYLGRRLRGLMRLRNDADGSVLEEKRVTLMRVPHLTERGTFLHGGSEYSTISQARLLPGVYTRRKANGEPECFHGLTKIWTEVGALSIGDIVNKRMAIRVWSYDFSSGEFVLKPVVNWFRNRVKAGMGRAKFEAFGRMPSIGGTPKSVLWATPVHKVFSADGDLREIQDNSKKLLMVEERMNAVQEQVVLGSLLGDGYIGEDGIFQEAHTVAQRDYLAWKADVLGDMTAGTLRPGKSSKNSFSPGARTVTMCSKSSAELRRLRAVFYPKDGVKVVPDYALQRLDARGLAVWFGDDGHARLVSNSTHTATASYTVILATNGFTKRGVTKLRDWFGARWGLASRLGGFVDVRSPHPRRRYQLILCGDDAEQFLDLVAPFLHASLRYKLAERPPTGKCRVCSREMDRRRKTCNACLLASYAGGGHRVRGGVKFRFGGRAAVEKLLAEQAAPSDPNPGARWDVRNTLLGTEAEKMRNNGGMIRVLAEIPYTFEMGNGFGFERTKIAYDIEVQDTHNYFAHGVLVSNCHFNVARGTGSPFRIRFESASALYKLDVGQSQLRLYSLLHDLDVPDEQLEKSWGPEILERNRAAYDSRVFDKAYARLVRKPDPNASRDEKKVAIRKAFDDMRVHRRVLQTNLPNLYDRTKAAAWSRAADVLRTKAAEVAVANFQQAQQGQLDVSELRALAIILNQTKDAGIELSGTRSDLIRQIEEFLAEGGSSLADLAGAVEPPETLTHA